MNIKSFFSLVIIITLSIILSSCSSFRSEMLLGDAKKIADTRLMSIIEAIEKKDTEGLKKMFSANALKEADDIDGGINYIMNFYKGKIESKEGAQEGSGSKDYGEKTHELKCFYIITTEEDKYIVFFIENLVDTKNPDNVGLYMLQIIKESDRKKEFDWGGKKTRCAGIYRSLSTENK